MTEPSKWPKSYWSQSKSEFLRLEDMPTPHLKNAIAKMERVPLTDDDVALLGYMREEVNMREHEEAVSALDYENEAP